MRNINLEKRSTEIARSANMDLMRIASMLLIILLHSIDHSGVLEASETAMFPMHLWVRFTYMLAQVCVNCYVLISGYFLVKSKFRLQKLVALYLETMFYSLVIRIVFIATGYAEFSISSLLSCFVPIITGRYWFITIYFGLYLVFPFLNIAINAMNRKQHLCLNIILFILFSVLVSVYPSFKGMNSGEGWGLAWFIVLYFCAAWFRLYYTPNNKKIRYLLIWVALSILIAVFYIICVNMIGRNNILVNAINNQYRYDSVFAYISSICILLFFINLKIKNLFFNKLIIFVAPSTLGVYLIHTHADFSKWFWTWLNLPSKMNSSMFIIIQLGGVVCGIFASCIFIDIIRRYTVGRIEKSRLVYNWCNKITVYLRSIISKISEVNNG